MLGNVLKSVKRITNSDGIIQTRLTRLIGSVKTRKVSIKTRWVRNGAVVNGREAVRQDGKVALT